MRKELRGGNEVRTVLLPESCMRSVSWWAGAIRLCNGDGVHIVEVGDARG